MKKPAAWFWKKQKEIDVLYEKYMALCDGDCGNVYREEDLNSTCYGGSFCNDCMCIFLMENEVSQEHSE